ncbi:hypothetical protein B0H17DRAFT_1199974 [Mycena rosella]|uniref:Gag protein n=1 Tax=Mycena rosella TaxID=1033263 RepID=A0AAD7GJ25_MYCRO|nr:hypothetical protein B0H17DRAFT_1199974 [Mycena rosella]
MPMEAWDGDTDKISAQDFLRAFHRDVKVTTSSADKAKAFKNYLAANSDADDWYQALPATTKLDMDLIDVAIEAQYPAEPTVKQTAAEYGTELLKCKLTKEELGTKVKVADREVWAHHAWGTKMLRLALKAGVSATTTYIEQVRVELPGPLRTKIAKTHVNWPAFIKAVRDVDMVELELDMKDWREEKEQRDEVAKLRQALQASPTAGIQAQLTNARLSTPAQASVRWPTPAPGANPFQGSGGGGQGNLFAAPRAPYQTQAPRAPYQPQAPRAPYPPQARPPMTIQPPLEGDQRRILLEAIARITHHPDTEAGYRCGIMGHTNYQRRCTATPNECVSIREQQWRKIASQALRDVPAAVRIVGFPSWDVDDFGRPFGGDEARFEETDDQGNA